MLQVEVVDAASVDDDVRARAEQILRRHARAGTSFQTLEHGFSYFFSGDGYVAFRAIGRAWVAAGAPIADPARSLPLALEFVAEARARRRRPSFFCVDAGFPTSDAFESLNVGEEPFYEPARWDAELRRHRSLREQLRRARAKGVTVSRLSAQEVAEDSPLRPVLDALAERWLDSRRMAPMSFLVQRDLFTRADARAFFVARREGEVVGLLVAVPVFVERGYLVEHAFRFAVDTLRHLRRSVLRALYLPLVLWTLAVAVAPERFFPWPSLRWIWVSLDLLLVLLLAGLVQRPKARRLRVLVWLSGFDALLSVAHVALWIGPRAQGFVDVLGLVVGLVGPASAFTLLSILRGRSRRDSV